MRLDTMFGDSPELPVNLVIHLMDFLDWGYDNEEQLVLYTNVTRADIYAAEIAARKELAETLGLEVEDEIGETGNVSPELAWGG
jgi:hypothetical protein|tara:strand:+ start:51 stop:302 length:252 start_codon:yes stop_codon:yes gene_type:complete